MTHYGFEDLFEPKYRRAPDRGYTLNESETIIVWGRNWRNCWYNRYSNCNEEKIVMFSEHQYLRGALYAPLFYFETIPPIELIEWFPRKKIREEDNDMR